MELFFTNTAARTAERFTPLQPGEVRMYTCGPTVYNYVHIGNLRTFLFEDVLRRTLKVAGFQVRQVMNLTDIDDKTIRGANAEGVSLRAYTDRYIAAFFEDIDTLRCERVEYYPRATDFIPQMVELIARLKEKGYTYELEGSTYFRIAAFPDYGKLSGVDPSQIKPGARVDADEYEKEDVRDFVLWKAARPGEPYWDTPFGPGRPGWHLECSTMAIALLGESIDIHAGGVDLIFPHHENEIAQSEAATGKPFVKYWLHSEHLVVEGQKMAKSAGNFFTLRDLLERGHDPLAIRYLLISVPYRQKLNFTFDALHAAEAAVSRIGNTLRRLHYAPAAGGEGDLPVSAASEFVAEFEKALGDDLNTARALAALHTFLTKVNQALDAGGLSAEAMSATKAALRLANGVLGVFPEVTTEETDAEVEALIQKRAEARARRDFATADAIRKQLADRGIILEDTPSGTLWRRVGKS
ncbi:cysteinyl-tRNA synthetase [Thermoanaerobaculum aquaticum]|uniref:Cysteine--tRNA ligase n=1 Tax=Thermoanaerobaculum aquaticum TaxID=1312852 RepID=A0A062XQY9_9BACT|nr:cysteine--tRNA ligase [Thermoanaerobaculum aquaticum]KDA53233.1 cysteinyl-tRNA synthetase [Thermoanaerobaculum aquaticum]